MPEFKTTLKIHNGFNILLIISAVFLSKYLHPMLLVFLLGLDIMSAGLIGLYYKRILFTKTEPLAYETSTMAKIFNYTLIGIGGVITLISLIVWVAMLLGYVD